jgi:polyhydroxyalkanoate synthase subunit PhaC
MFTDCNLTIVLTNGGHDSGILPEPGHPRRHYRIGHRPQGAHYVGPDAWAAAQRSKPGSWWTQQATWLAAGAGDPISPPAVGAPNLGPPQLGAAPGTNVFRN